MDTPTLQLVTEEFMVPGPDAGIELYVRNKRPQSLSTFTRDNVVLFVHGATYPADTSFDLKLEGLCATSARGRGVHQATPQRGQDQPAELVVGLAHHADVHHRQ
jgi:hypothetical protein